GSYRPDRGSRHDAWSRYLAQPRGSRRAHRRAIALLHLARPVGRGPSGAGGLFPALRVARDPQGVPRLEDEGVRHVPVHRLADGLLVAPPQPAPPQRSGQPAGSPVHRLRFPRTPHDRRHRPGLQLHLHSEEPDEGGIALRRRGSGRTGLRNHRPDAI
ncbi:MAG: hypothetical protein AVDCRST_MAG78-1350, partial [uncultured Rubrobacteraceae bacterium]